MSQENKQGYLPGVLYYNIDKEEKEDKAFKEVKDCFASLSGRAANAAQDLSVSTPQVIPLDVYSSQTESPTPYAEVEPDLIKMDDVLYAPIQLWYNENSVQRYKLKIQLNLKNDQRYEFIAALTQDRRNFCKYLPEASKQWFKDWTDNWVRDQRRFDHKIYRGKFHLNQGRAGHTIHNQIEDYCACAVWWDKTKHEWVAAVNLYAFETIVRLDKGCISIKQEQAGLVAQTQYRSQEYIKSLPQRPKTLWQILNNK